MLKEKVAVVTGGTRGIGFEIVRKYLANGAKVVLFGSRQETVDEALKKLKEENSGWEVSGKCPKLTDAAEVEKAITEVKEQYGRIDILVNNAGISQSTPLYDYTPEEFDKVIDLNVKALFYAILPAAKIMKEQGGGCIINTSSMVSISGALPEQVVQRISSTIPIGRPGEPEEVANAFLYLASDMASYVTGEILSVDGASKA